MGSPINSHEILRGVSFTKTANEIKAAATTKIAKLEGKIAERQKRIVDLRKEYDINDAALIQLLTEARRDMQHGHTKMSYNFSNSLNAVDDGDQRVVGAGIVTNILTESDMIESEKEQVTRLKMIVRNIKPIPKYATGNGTQLPDEGFHMSDTDLEYFNM